MTNLGSEAAVLSAAGGLPDTPRVRGALLGGWALAALGAHRVMIVAAVVCAAVLPTGWATRHLTPPAAASPES